jgi:hypothetical protein
MPPTFDVYHVLDSIKLRATAEKHYQTAKSSPDNNNYQNGMPYPGESFPSGNGPRWHTRFPMLHTVEASIPEAFTP